MESVIAYLCDGLMKYYGKRVKYIHEDKPEMLDLCNAEILEYERAISILKNEIKPKEPKFCQCDCPTGRSVSEDFEDQVCDTCGRVVN